MLIPLNLVRDQPLQRQIYEQLRDLIASSRLLPGTRMPSTRMMAEEFGVSRVTVLLTYERLIADGLLETRPASGTFVCLPPSPHAAVPHPAPAKLEPIGPGGAVRATVGQPDPSLFPAGRWRSLMRGALDHLGAQVRTDALEGGAGLRTAIASWLSGSRGLAVSPEQILLTGSRSQGLHLAAHLAVSPGARVIIEDPCHAELGTLLAAEHGDLVRVPVDEDGLCTDLLPEGAAVLLHVTPEHQCPLGVQMSLARRFALLAWATRAGALVLEEDFLGELHHGGNSLPSLMALDSEDRVIRLGGFNASLGPWVGLSYLVLPRHLAAAGRAAWRLLFDRRAGLEEAALTELMVTGAYARHVHRIGKAYAVRRDALVESLRRHFGAAQSCWGSQSGLHLTWFPPADLGPAGYLSSVARRCGLEAGTLSAATLARLPGGQALLLGFGSHPVEQIVARVAHFAELVHAAPADMALSAD